MTRINFTKPKKDNLSQENAAALLLKKSRVWNIFEKRIKGRGTKNNKTQYFIFFFIDLMIESMETSFFMNNERR